MIIACVNAIMQYSRNFNIDKCNMSQLSTTADTSSHPKETNEVEVKECKMSVFKKSHCRILPWHRFERYNAVFTSGRVKTAMYIYVLHIKNLVAEVVADISAHNHCVYNGEALWQLSISWGNHFLEQTKLTGTN